MSLNNSISKGVDIMAQRIENQAEEQTSVCCEASVIGEVEFDSVDGDYGVPYVVGHGQCSDCRQWSRFA
jgi:hypothetical protein